MMFWLYVFPMLVCAVCTISLVFQSWKQKGFCEGDDLGMIATSFLPLLNWFLFLILCYALWDSFFNKKERYFERKSK